MNEQERKQKEKEDKRRKIEDEARRWKQAELQRLADEKAL